MYASATPRQTAASALASAGIVALIGLALVLGLRAGQVLHDTGSLISVVLDADKPPPPPEPKSKPKPSVKSAPKGAPSPRNLRNKAAQVVAPPPRILLAPPPPMPVATQSPGTGSAANNGASDQRGTGQGAGGIGNGLGGGGQGGDGWGRPVKGPRQIRGKLSYADMPDGLLQEGQEASVGVIYTVEIDGRVSQCRADQPSGYAVLDALTCRLIEQRFRFRPARDRAGDPVPSKITERHYWFVRPED